MINKSGKEIPASVVAEVFNKLRKLEADYFRWSGNMKASAPKDDTAARVWQSAAEHLQQQLDRCELHIADLGYEIPVDNNLTVGAEVRELFGEER